MFTVGIDLGTTASVVSYVKDGKPQVIRICGNTSIPSVVNYSSSLPIVGREAIYKADSLNTIFSIKRHIGSNRKFLNRTPTEISADILYYLKSKTEELVGQNIDAAVITVPAHFSDIQRTATKRAASIAGLKVLRLINEPTAAALAFGIEKRKNGMFLVYDFGGGTFDCSLLRLEDGVFQVLATGGDNHLGGDDVDNDILNNNFSKNGISNITNDEYILGKLVAKYLKENLKEQDKIESEFICKGKKYNFCLTKQELKEFSSKSLNRTLDICRQVLEDANIDKSEINNVILVGGMTRLKLIKDSVYEFLKVPLCDDLNPEEVVSLGAAIQAQSISEKNSNMILIDVVSLTLGIETFGGGVDRIIYRNTPIPISERREYTTYQDNQHGIKFHVVQGERLLADECQTLANFELKGIPSMPAGMPRVIVDFNIDINGILSIKAFEKTTGISQSVVVTETPVLSESDVFNILQKAYEEQENDKIKIRNIDISIELNRLLKFWNLIINDIPFNERKIVSKKIKELNSQLSSKNFDATILLKSEIESIIGKFLDEIISCRLSGKKLADMRRI